MSELLSMGLDRFDLDIGILSRIEESLYTVVGAVAPPGVDLAPGTEFQLGMTYCSVRRNLEQLVRTDPITELLDRRGVGETFERQAERSSFDGAALSCILIDIDDFKEINDRWGHSVGDRVICSVADVIRASVRPSDAAGRIGGDEFLAVLPGATPSEARLVAERIRNGVRDMRLSENGALVDATVSIGVSSVPTDVTSVTDVLTLTEDLLRSSKRSGKDTVSVRRKAG